LVLYRNNGKRGMSESWKKTISLIVMIIFAIATLFPIYFMFVSSFADPVSSGSISYSLLPQKLTLASYKFFFDFSPYSLRWLLNSLIVASIVTTTNVLFAGMAGYAFSKIDFHGKKVIFIISFAV
jgi:multiple sugar transport system permease protein